MVKTLSLTLTGRDPAIVGTVVWSDPGHARHLVADAGEVTRIRTGAITGVATDLLAPSGARTQARSSSTTRRPRSRHSVVPSLGVRIPRTP
jgi:ornithine cyclodeaminase